MPGPSDAFQPAQQPTRAPRARVVVLHGPGAVVPEELREALRRNNSEPIAVDHALGAMAHLCGAKAAVLLLCEPENLVGVRELLGAVERYTPRVTRWEYIAGENPPLRPIAGSVVVPTNGQVSTSGRTATTPTVPAADSGSNGGPIGGPVSGGTMRSADPFALRLTKDPGLGQAGRSASTGDLLTRDEMEALFSEDSP